MKKQKQQKDGEASRQKPKRLVGVRKGKAPRLGGTSSGVQKIGGRAVAGHQSARARQAARRKAKANGRVVRVAGVARERLSGYVKTSKRPASMWVL